MKKSTLSGIQATGNLHIGNYLGSIQNWITMQNDYQCYFFIANLHALTTNQDSKKIKKSTLTSIATYIASGIDPKKSIIFVQSDIKEHTNLAWIINCITPLSWLKRMTQFKDKSSKNQENINVGLLTYPTLMAADILLYNPDVIPVGEDQKQHIELTRDIAHIINKKSGNNILKIPEPLIQGVSTRIMSLRDGTQKMSKSNPSDASRINLTDSPELIVKKIKKSKTDSIEEIYYDKVNRPEISNLINIFSALTKHSLEQIIIQYSGKDFAKFKSELADIIVEKLTPIQKHYNNIVNDHEFLIKIKNDGAEKARKKAEKTYLKIAAAFGIV